MNIIAHVEIPVVNLERAMEFYGSVFQTTLSEIANIHENRMAFLPFTEGADGASAALAEGEIYVPSQQGAVIYFWVADLGAVLERAVAQGTRILFPKTAVGDGLWVAEITDSEGNRIALQSRE